jgi:hypothetical protein
MQTDSQNSFCGRSYEFSKKKPQTLLTGGLKRVTSRDPYQSIDLIEYYKSYNGHKELGRGRQALEAAKVKIFLSNFYNF